MCVRVWAAWLLNANYKKAMNSLVNRFDIKVLHFQAYVQALIDLNGVEKGSSKGQLAIRTLTTKQQILDGLLIHIVSRKMDQRTREKWKEDLSITELSTWDAMEPVLERRCRMMENLDQALVTKHQARRWEKTCTNVTKINLLLLLLTQII